MPRLGFPHVTFFLVVLHNLLRFSVLVLRASTGFADYDEAAQDYLTYLTSLATIKVNSSPPIGSSYLDCGRYSPTLTTEQVLVDISRIH